MAVAIRSFVFMKDDLEIRVICDLPHNSIRVIKDDFAEQRIDCTQYSWVNDLFSTLYRFDPDCCLDKNDEMSIRGELIRIVSPLALETGFGIK